MLSKIFVENGVVKGGLRRRQRWVSQLLRYFNEKKLLGALEKNTRGVEATIVDPGKCQTTTVLCQNTLCSPVAPRGTTGCLWLAAKEGLRADREVRG